MAEKDQTPEEQQAAAKERVDAKNTKRNEANRAQSAANRAKGLTARGRPRSTVHPAKPKPEDDS